MSAVSIYTFWVSLILPVFLLFYNLLIGTKNYDPQNTDWNRWGLFTLFSCVCTAMLIFPACHLFFSKDTVGFAASPISFIISAIIILTSCILSVAAAYYYCIQKRREHGVVASIGTFALVACSAAVIIITTAILFLC